MNLWDIMPYSLSKFNRHFGVTCCNYLQGQRISQTIKTILPEHGTSQVTYSPQNRGDIDANVMLDLIHLAQDRGQWRAFMNAVLRARAG
jgi:hypothetical protein